MACKNSMRRTTSLTEFAPPSVLAVVLEDEDDEVIKPVDGDVEEGRQDWLAAYGGGGGGHGTAGTAAPGRDWLATYCTRAAPARAGLRRNSADYSAVETAAFLRHCGLCRRLLGPGRDTFMYRGDAAFCSLECRQQHIAHEEWKDKCALAAPAVVVMADTVAPATASSVDQPNAGGTLAAA